MAIKATLQIKTEWLGNPAFDVQFKSSPLEHCQMQDLLGRIIEFLNFTQFRRITFQNKNFFISNTLA